MAGLVAVTDPDTLAQLNQQIGSGPFSPPKGYAPIADPDLLAQLNATAGVDNGAQPLITGADAEQGLKHGLASGTVGIATGIPDLSVSINKFAARHVKDVDDWMVNHGLISRDALDKQDKDFAAKYGANAAAQDAATGGKVLPSTQDVVQGNLGIAAPTTAGGKAISNVASFLPGAATGGSVASVIRNGLVPGLMSEGAGQAADTILPGTGAGDVARLAGGLYGQSKMAPVQQVGSAEDIARRAADVATLERNGIPVTAGEATGNKQLREKENYLAPENRDRALQAYTKNMLDSITGGNNSGTIQSGPGGTVDTMFNRLSQRYDNVPNYSLPADNQLVNDIVTHGQTHHTQGVSPAADTAVQAMQDRILNAAIKPGGITGQDYQTLRSSFARQARGTSDPGVRDALNDMNGVLDSAMERGMQQQGATPAQLQDFRSLSGDYRNALVLEKAINANGGAAHITPEQVARAAQSTFGRDFSRGATQFNDVTDAARNVIKPLPYDTAGRQEARGSKLGDLTMLGAKMGGAALGHAILPGVDPVFGLLAAEGLGNVVKGGVNGVRRQMVTGPLAQYLYRHDTGNIPGLLTTLHSAEEPNGQSR